MFTSIPFKALALYGFGFLLACFAVLATGASLLHAGEVTSPAKSGVVLKLEGSRSFNLKNRYPEPHLLPPEDLQYSLEIQPGTAVKSFSRNMAALMHLTSQRTTWRDLWSDILKTNPGSSVAGAGKMISYVGLSSVSALVDSMLSQYYAKEDKGLITRLQFFRNKGPGVAAKLQDMAEIESSHISELVLEYRF